MNVICKLQIFYASIFLLQINCKNFKVYYNGNQIENVKRAKIPKESNIDFYITNKNSYTIFSHPVSWLEANMICHSYESVLAILDDEKELTGLSTFLSESNIVGNIFWIGLKKNNSNLDWTSTTEMLETTSEPTEESSCKAIKRHKRSIYSFIDAPCTSTRPFICAKSIEQVSNNNIKPVAVNLVSVGDIKFIFYKSRITWGEALAFCGSMGSRLAVIPDKQMVEIIAKSMVVSRPDIFNLWIGASYTNGNWQWIANDKKLPTLSQNNYPPWRDNDTVTNLKKCLIIDRHFQKLAYFLPAACSTKRDFICEKSIHNRAEGHTFNNFSDYDDKINCPYKNQHIQIYLMEKNWLEAKKYCRENNSTLAEPKSYEFIQAIVTCLENHVTEPKHLWLGGFYRNKEWIWISNNSTITEPLPWCEDTFDETDPCLNLDRLNHVKIVTYGLKCKRKQPFACISNIKKEDYDEVDRRMAKTEQETNSAVTKSYSEFPDNSIFLTPLYYTLRFFEDFKKATTVKKSLKILLKQTKFTSQLLETITLPSITLNKSIKMKVTAANKISTKLNKTNIKKIRKENYKKITTTMPLLHHKKYFNKTVARSKILRKNNVGKINLNVETRKENISSSNDCKQDLHFMYHIQDIDQLIKKETKMLDTRYKMLDSGIMFLLEDSLDIYGIGASFVELFMNLYPPAFDFGYSIITFGKKVKVIASFYTFKNCKILNKIKHLHGWHESTNCSYVKALEKAEEEINIYDRHKIIIYLLTKGNCETAEKQTELLKIIEEMYKIVDILIRFIIIKNENCKNLLNLSITNMFSYYYIVYIDDYKKFENSFGIFKKVHKKSLNC